MSASVASSVKAKHYPSWQLTRRPQIVHAGLMRTEARKATDKAYYQRNKAAICARVAKYQADNPDKRAADIKRRNQSTKGVLAKQRYYARNQARVQTAAKEWAEAHPEYNGVRKSKRRARELGASGSHTRADRQAVFESYGHRCIVCAADLLQLPSKDRTLDHVVPFAKGGSNCVSNLQPMCRSCNSRKGDR